MAAGEDKTSRKRAEEALRESEDRFRRLSEAALEGIAISEAGKILDANEQLAEMLGYPVDELIGMDAMEFVAPESRDLVMRNIASQYDATYEHLAQRSDGSTFPAEVHGVSMRYEGRTARVTAIRDITERIRAEEALRESEERFRTVFDKAPVAIVISDPGAHRDARYTDVNDQACDLLGYTKDELVGARVSDFVDPEYLDRWIQLREQAFEEETPSFNTDIMFIAKGGETLWVEGVLGLVRDESGEPLYAIGMARDITQRKRMEEALQKAREELEGRVERQLLRRNPYGLTFRELTVLHLVATGKSDKDIGLELGISPLTASKHLSNILAKISVASRTEASVRAVKEGLLD